MDRSFVASAKQKFKVGDIVVGLVEKVESWGIDLNTSSPQFGVLKAFCSKCRSALQLEARQLKCTNCKNLEFRKVSSGYWLQ
jgi:exosome complex component CSL4